MVASASHHCDKLYAVLCKDHQIYDQLSIWLMTARQAGSCQTGRATNARLQVYRTTGTHTTVRDLRQLPDYVE